MAYIVMRYIYLKGIVLFDSFEMKKHPLNIK